MEGKGEEVEELEEIEEKNSQKKEKSQESLGDNGNKSPNKVEKSKESTQSKKSTQPKKPIQSKNGKRDMLKKSPSSIEGVKLESIDQTIDENSPIEKKIRQVFNLSDDEHYEGGINTLFLLPFNLILISSSSSFSFNQRI